MAVLSLRAESACINHIGPVDRLAIEAEIERLIAMLDMIDGDPDREPDEEDCCEASDDDPRSIPPRSFHPVFCAAGDHEDAEDEDVPAVWPIDWTEAGR